MERLNRESAQGCINAGEDVTEEQLAGLAGGDSVDRQYAALALFKTRLRQAVDALGQLGLAQDFTDQRTIDLLEQLAKMASNEAPLVEGMKRLGLRAAAAGDFERAAQLLEGMANRAAMIGQRQDARSRAAMRYLHDREVDTAYAELARRLPNVTARPSSSSPLRVAMLVSGIVDDNSGSRVAAAIVRGLRELGHDVRFVSTEHVPSAQGRFPAILEAEGIPFVRADTGGHETRARSLLMKLQADPVHVTLYLTFPMDAVAKLVACAGLSDAQVFMNTSYEQFCGRFDAILQTVSEAQITTSVRPDISRFVGTGLIAGSAIDAALAESRAQFGVAQDQMLLGTYGRLQKCCEPGYMHAVARILQERPQAILLLAGPAYDQEVSVLSSHFQAAGVAERVRFLGPRENDVPGLLKATDVYLDSFPFPGAQSILEAMWAGCAVVGMRTVTDAALDPSGTGPTTATAEVFLGDDYVLARGGDVDEYVRLALGFIDEPIKRRAAGDALAARARALFDFGQWIGRINAALLEAVGAHGL